jgi:predicted acylesterase/phospholipase RssA
MRWVYKLMGAGAVVGIVAGVGFFYWSGTHLASYITSVTALSLVVFGLGSRLSGRKLGWIFCLVAWVLCSLYPILFDRKAETQNPSRFKHILRRYPDLRVGIAVSGGGYRASLFHAGVLSALDDIGVTPSAISSVSGGSITSSFYALGGNPADIVLAMQQERFNFKRELIWLQNAARLPFPGAIPQTRLKLLPGYEFSRTDVQASLLDRVLLGKKTFGDLADDAPTLMLCATDLQTGRIVGVTPHGVITFLSLSPSESVNPRAGALAAGFKEFPQGEYEPFTYESNLFPRNERISSMVAASGAFPLAFEPVERHVRFKEPNSHRLPKEKILRLVDGGITDNSALTLMLETENYTSYPDQLDRNDDYKKLVEDWKLDLIVSSDAGSIFSDKMPGEIGSDPARALDIIYARVVPRSARSSRLQAYPPAPKIVSISPQSLLPYPYSEHPPGDIFFHTQAAGPVSYLDEQGFRAILAEFPDRVEELVRQRNAQRAIAQTANEDKCSVENHEGEGDVAVERLVSDKVDDAVKVFLRTDTLEDQIPSTDAARLYNLGRYLLLLKFGQIQQEVVRRQHLLAGQPCPVTPPS